MRGWFKLLSRVGLISVFANTTFGATIVASGLSASAVQSAINAAAFGDTVLLPAGSATWTTRVSIGLNKPVNLQGAGIGQTIITRDIADNTTAALSISVTEGNFITVSGLEFRTVGTASLGTVEVLGGPTASPVFRITGCKVQAKGRGIRVENTYGVIDNCIIVSSDSGSNQGITVWRSEHTNLWTTPQAYGTQLATVIEDCTFDYVSIGDGAIDAYDNTKFVFRYNTVTNTSVGWHGADSGGYPRAPRLWEVYGNRFYANVSVYTGIRARGGTGVIWSNSFTGTFGSMIWFSHYSADPNYIRGGWGRTTGSNPADGNFNSFGYPPLDQIGRGSFPSNTRWYNSSVTSYNNESGGYQVLEPAYQWGNNFRGDRNPTATVTGPSQSANFIKPGRDYYDNIAKPGYVPLVYPHPARNEQVTGTNDGTAPLIGNLVSGNPFANSATITWTTDEPATSVVDYGLLASYSTSITNSSLKTSHQMLLTGLTPNTLYRYRVRSADAWGNQSVSGDLTFTTPPEGQGSVWYVDKNHVNAADTSSNGSEEKPWRTISYALGQMQGGDVLYVKSGTYAETPYISSSLSGTSSKPTTIKAYPGASVTVQGAGINTGRIKINGCSYVVLDGFRVTQMNHGIYVEASSQVKIQNCTVYYIGQEGIHVMGNSANITLENCKVYQTGRWIYNGEGIYVGTGSTGARDNTSLVTIRSNVVHDTTDEAIELKPGTHDCVIDGNLVYNATSSATWGAIELGEHALGNQFWGSNPNHTVRNNILYNTDTAIRAGTGCLVYNNVIYSVRSGNYGIYCNNNAGDTYTRFIYHNSIDLPSSSALRVASDSVIIRNNIGPSLSDNIPSNSAYFVDSGGGNYHLVSGSAPVDAGVDLSSTVPLDLDGTPRPIGLRSDMGAYEYVGGRPSTPQDFQILGE